MHTREMALHDWQATQEKILRILQTSGRHENNLIDDVLAYGEYEDDVISLLQEMKSKGIINKNRATWHLVTKERLERAALAKEEKPKEANPWAWYLWSPDSAEFRQALRQQFTYEDGRVFRSLAALLMKERPPRLGERAIGPMTEDEWEYISRINEKIQAFRRTDND